MTQVVVDLLEGQAVGDEAGGAGVAQRVRADRNAKYHKPLANDAVDRAGC